MTPPSAHAFECLAEGCAAEWRVSGWRPELGCGELPDCPRCGGRYFEWLSDTIAPEDVCLESERSHAPQWPSSLVIRRGEREVRVVYDHPPGRVGRPRRVLQRGVSARARALAGVFALLGGGGC